MSDIPTSSTTTTGSMSDDELREWLADMDETVRVDVIASLEPDEQQRIYALVRDSLAEEEEEEDEAEAQAEPSESAPIPEGMYWFVAAEYGRLHVYTLDAEQQYVGTVDDPDGGQPAGARGWVGIDAAGRAEFVQREEAGDARLDTPVETASATLHVAGEDDPDYEVAELVRDKGKQKIDEDDDVPVDTPLPGDVEADEVEDETDGSGQQPTLTRAEAQQRSLEISTAALAAAVARDASDRTVEFMHSEGGLLLGGPHPWESVTELRSASPSSGTLRFSRNRMSANDFVVERVSSGTVDVDGLQDDLRTLLSGMKAVYTYGDGDRVRVRLR